MIEIIAVCLFVNTLVVPPTGVPALIIFLPLLSASKYVNSTSLIFLGTIVNVIVALASLYFLLACTNTSTLYVPTFVGAIIGEPSDVKKLNAILSLSNSDSYNSPESFSLLISETLNYILLYV